MRYPTDDPRVSSPFGYRTHPVTGDQKLHAGADFPRPGGGAPLYAVDDFTVIDNGWSREGGWYVFLRLPDGLSARYFHMRGRSPLTVGKHGPEGTHVGVMGNTGAATTGPHLHFEIRRPDGTPIDPIPYLTAGIPAGGASTPFPDEEDDMKALFLQATSINDVPGGPFHRWIVDPGAGTKRNINAADWDFYQKTLGVPEPHPGVQPSDRLNQYRTI